MIYLDTSALLKLYVEEPGTDAVRKAVAGHRQPVMVSWLNEVELSSAFRLMVFRKDAKAKSPVLSTGLKKTWTRDSRSFQ